MTPRGTWDSPKAAMCGRTAAKEEAGVAGKDTRTSLHGCGSPVAPRPSPGYKHAIVCTGPACTTLALLLCSLVQLTVASLQFPASSSATARLLHHSEVFTHHALLRNNGGSGQIPPAAVTTTHPAEDMSPDGAEGGTLHAPARAPRSITAIQRVELHGPPVTHRKTLFVEVVVLADYSLYRHYGTRERVLQRVRQVLSVANTVLGALGVVLVPMDVKVWASGDQIRVTSTLDTNIEGLQQHRLSLLQWHPKRPNDHTILLTRKQMPGGGSCGAPVRGMCRKQQSVSVVQDEGEGASVTGVTLAHHVGHSLGMEDDAEDPDHACRCAASTCVMSRHFRNGSSPNLTWSACSKQSFDSALETLALDCLNNVPTSMYYDRRSSCGDGVVDDGEQCDCGPVEFCDNPCCVAATCRLALNASCASGSCCDFQECQPKPPGAMCRAAITECDLPEFCSGHSEYCPKDVTKTDGEPCREGHCFKGECGSREGQCKRVWGDSASAASPDCYSELNVRGTHAGNCGMRANGFRRCRKQESLCGTLHCIASASSSRLLQDHRNGSGRAGSHMCQFISASDNYPANHWLTPDGAPCGTGKMCIKQRCKDVPLLTGDCHDGCSGNGVCNSLGHCHCDAGFAPPNCSLAGLGGSVDSNMMADVSDPRLLITTVWVVVVLLFSLLAVTCCLWGCFKGWYKQKGRDIISGALPCCADCLDVCCCPVMTKTARWMLTVGSSSKKKQMEKNIEVEEGMNERMLCSVGVDIKGTLQTNSWGVANDKLVTEVVTIEPKDSPDFLRTVKLPRNSPLLHHKSEDNLHRPPNYQQSISMDSGCVSDSDEDNPNKRASLRMSMSSLVNIFLKFGDKKNKTMPDNETLRTKNLGSQKSIPLSRFVLDPLVGRHGSRQGTPPPHPVRPSYNRSYSTDVVSAGRNIKEGTPPLPPPSVLKQNKSEDNLYKGSEMASRGRFSHRQDSHPVDAPSVVSASSGSHVQSHGAMDAATTATTTTKAPLRPPKNKPLPSLPKVPPKQPDSPLETGNQQHQGENLQGKPIPLSGAPRTSPPSTPSRSQSSSTGSVASTKVMEMTRKFECV